MSRDIYVVTANSSAIYIYPRGIEVCPQKSIAADRHVITKLLRENKAFNID